MSAEPSNPSGSPGRNRPQLSDLSRETTEDDLWNLDEEPAAARPRQSKLSPPPSPPSKDPVPAPEPATTLEPPKPRGLATPAKPLSPRTSQPDEIGDLDEDEADSPAPDEVPTLTSAIDEDPSEEVKTPVPPAPTAKSPAAPVEVPPPIEEPEPADSEDAENEDDEADEEQSAPSAPRENRPRSAASAGKVGLTVARLNRREVIGIASFAVVIMIAAVWVISHFFSQLSFTRESDSKPSYPLKGELARIASASTFWREPVRSGESRDVARREVVLIPVLELTLDPENSGGGSLRVIFRNSEGQPLGDPITRSFGAGRFEASGSATVSFAATDGFTADGDFQAYRTGKGKLWTADVLEGPPGDGPASSFKKLSSIPILPDRR
jgi:hypothetical protein